MIYPRLAKGWGISGIPLNDLIHRNLSFTKVKPRIKGRKEKRREDFLCANASIRDREQWRTDTRAESRGFFLRMRVLIMRGGETSPTTHTNYANCRMHHYGAQCSVHQVHPFHHPSRNILVHPFARPRAERVELRERRGSWRDREREESIALPSARPQTSTVVDLAEHFNDSSLPRAFTVPAVARLGQQSVHARSMKQLLNN